MLVINIIKFILFTVITFLMFNIIANKRKSLAVLGTLLVCFSTASIEYISSGFLESMIFGQSALILINEFLKSSKLSLIKEIGIFVGIFFTILGFFLLSNISFQISIGIILLGLLIWIFIKNKKEINSKKILLLTGVLVLSIIPLVFLYKVLPMKNLENVPIMRYLTSYSYSCLLPFNENIKLNYQETLTTFVTVFPLPIIISLIYLYKIGKHSEFILPMIVGIILEILLAIIFKISNIVPNYIMALGIGLAQIMLIVYFYANVKEKLFNMKLSSYLTLGFLVLIVIMPGPAEIFKRLNLSFMSILLTIEGLITFKYEDIRFQKVATYLFGIITLIGFVAYLF